MPEVPVNGKVLEWARTLRGLDIERAAKLLTVPPEELVAYESGTKKPLVGFLRLMSAKYQINFTSLLMPEPLPKEQRPVDYRARHDHPLSVETMVAIEEVKEALEAFKEIADESATVVRKLTIGIADLRDNPETIAIRERKRFGVTVEEQRGWHNQRQARGEWRQHIEAHGVFTYMIPMPPELSGFSMARDGLAAICVNDEELIEGRKIFSLLHEYCHLLLRQTGISDENNNNAVERFCNEFAASFLIPRDPLIEAIGSVDIPYEFSDADVRRLARRFRVSNSAMALRLEKTGVASKGFYARRTGPWDIPKEPKARTPEKEVKIPRIKVRMKRVGRLHAETVVKATQRRLINSLDASELMGIPPSSLSKIQAELR